MLAPLASFGIHDAMQSMLWRTAASDVVLVTADRIVPLRNRRSARVPSVDNSLLRRPVGI